MTRTRSAGGVLVALAAIALTIPSLGCGASYRSSGARAETTGLSEMADISLSRDGDGGYGSTEVEEADYGGLASGTTTFEPPQPPERGAPVVAQASTGSDASAQTATDAQPVGSTLRIIYTAVMHLAVYEVADAQRAIATAATEMGGFVFAQSDDRIVVRVPAARFRELLDGVEAAGQVLARDVTAQDVSEEFQDLEIRIRNLEAMRARVEALLASATTVEQALHVERELERITSELERMRGRLRFLADRVSLSTITVVFRPRPRESIDQPEIFELPFGWLDQLGLGTLLEVR